MNTAFLEWFTIAASIAGTIIAVVRGYFDYKKSKDYGAEFTAAVVCLCLVGLSLTIVQQSREHQKSSSELKSHIDSKFSFDIEVADGPNEADILKKISTQIEDNKQDYSKLYLMRMLSVPGALPGSAPNQDTLVGNAFKAHGFHLTYVIAFPWSNPDSTGDHDRQREMGTFFTKLMTSDSWPNLSSETVSSRKEIFHVPVVRFHDSWVVMAGKRSRAGMAFVKDWGSPFYQGFESVLFIDRPSVASGVVRDLQEMRKLGAAHLRTELAKPDVADRCPCTLFAGSSPETGLQPISRMELEKRISPLNEGRFKEIVRSAFPSK